MSKEIRIECGHIAMAATLNANCRTQCIAITSGPESHETIYVSPEELRDIRDMAEGFLAVVNGR